MITGEKNLIFYESQIAYYWHKKMSKYTSVSILNYTFNENPKMLFIYLIVCGGISAEAKSKPAIRILAARPIIIHIKILI